MPHNRRHSSSGRLHGRPTRRGRSLTRPHQRRCSRRLPNRGGLFNRLIRAVRWDRSRWKIFAAGDQQARLNNRKHLTRFRRPGQPRLPIRSNRNRTRRDLNHPATEVLGVEPVCCRRGFRTRRLRIPSAALGVRFDDPTRRKEHEGWGTRRWVTGVESKLVRSTLNLPPATRLVKMTTVRFGEPWAPPLDR